MFMGTYYNSIDAKNRMIVPSKHREQLGSKCVLTIGLDPCLYIYSEKEWERMMEKLAELPKSDQALRSFIRRFCSYANDLEFDKQGRLVIPPHLKEYAHIDKDLITMGAMEKIEVWSKEVWEAPDNENRMDNMDFAEILRKYDF